MLSLMLYLEERILWNLSLARCDCCRKDLRVPHAVPSVPSVLSILDCRGGLVGDA